jgi:8-hydroxy-5-deazaflavin:NADPH oxidoreductase
MRIAVIGSGDMGGALALALARRHEVTVSGSRPGSASARRVVDASSGRIAERPAADAVADADVVLLAVPWSAVDETLDGSLPLDGKVLVCVTVPWVGDDADALALGTTTSGAEHVASRAPGARVVQAFSTVSSTTVADPAAHGVAATAIVCGDDANARAVAVGLARDVGLDAVEAGPLRSARYTEPMAMLWTMLAFESGHGEDVAFRVLRRGSPSAAQGTRDIG